MVIFTTRRVSENEQSPVTETPKPHGCPMSCLVCNFGWMDTDHEHFEHPEAPVFEIL